MTGPHGVPVVLVSGVRESAMPSARMSLQLGLPEAVSVRHTVACSPMRN